jgi:hypothetical protein
MDFECLSILVPIPISSSAPLPNLQTGFKDNVPLNHDNILCAVLLRPQTLVDFVLERSGLVGFDILGHFA